MIHDGGDSRQKREDTHYSTFYPSALSLLTSPYNFMTMREELKEVRKKLKASKSEDPWSEE